MLMRRKAVNSINVTGNSRLFWCAKILKLPSDPIKKTRWQKKETLFFFFCQIQRIHNPWMTVPKPKKDITVDLVGLSTHKKHDEEGDSDHTTECWNKQNWEKC